MRCAADIGRQTVARHRLVSLLRRKVMCAGAPSTARTSRGFINANPNGRRLAMKIMPTGHWAVAMPAQPGAQAKLAVAEPPWAQLAQAKGGL